MRTFYQGVRVGLPLQRSCSGTRPSRRRRRPPVEAVFTISGLTWSSAIPVVVTPCFYFLLCKTNDSQRVATRASPLKHKMIHAFLFSTYMYYYHGFPFRMDSICRRSTRLHLYDLWLGLCSRARSFRPHFWHLPWKLQSNIIFGNIWLLLWHTEEKLLPWVSKSVGFQPFHFITSSYLLFCDLKDSHNLLDQVKMGSAITKGPPISFFTALGLIFVTIVLSIWANRPGHNTRRMKWFEHSDNLWVIFSGICTVPLFIGVLFHVIFLANTRSSGGRAGAGFYMYVVGIVILGLQMSILLLWPKKKDAEEGAKEGVEKWKGEAEDVEC